MKTLFFWLVLSFALFGCDEECQEGAGSCLDRLYKCDTEIVLEINDRYCRQTITKWNDLDDLWAQCETFRRGQVCQCLGYECYDSIIMDLKTNGKTTEEMDLLYEVQLWQCPYP